MGRNDGCAPPTLHRTFTAPFSGVAVVRVTGPGGTALGSAWIDITTTGSAPMGDEEACATDAEGNPVTSDADGRPLPCAATLQPDPPGVIVTSTESQPDHTVTALQPTAGRTQAEAISAVPLDFRSTDESAHRSPTTSPPVSSPASAGACVRRRGAGARADMREIRSDR